MEQEMSRETTTSTGSEPIQVNGQVLALMKMNRKDRRHVARKFGLKNILSIHNAHITKVEQPSNGNQTT